jgi:hypothetical protein
MLGAVRTHALANVVSIPPRADELTPDGARDWASGVGLLETCLATHDTQTCVETPLSRALLLIQFARARSGLAPEIVHFRIPSDGLDDKEDTMPHDWYIKGARCVLYTLRQRIPPLS